MQSVQSPKDHNISSFLARYNARRDELPGARNLREKAVKVFQDIGLPSRKTETWKYSDLRHLYLSDFDLPTVRKVNSELLAPFILEGANVIVFVDGIFSSALSKNDWIEGRTEFQTLSNFLKAENKRDPWYSIADIKRAGLTALNTLLMHDGMVLQIPANVTIKNPIQVIFLNSENSSVETHLRNLIAIGENSTATIMQSYITLGTSTSFCNVVTEVSLAKGANLRQVILQDLGETNWNIGQTTVQLEENAHFDNFVLSSGARKARSEICVKLNGKEANCSLKGLALVRGNQHCDNTTEVIHNTSNCRSSQLYKNVLDNKSRTVFQGRIFVAPDSQKTEAFQMSRNLLLSRGAQADSKPELIIHADDVKCSHGAAVGDLDQNALFYLKSRGIDPQTAHIMMVEAFVSDLIEPLCDDEIKTHLEDFITSWLLNVETEKMQGVA